MLENFASYHCMQFQGKLMNKTWENGKKPSFKPNFGPFGPYSGRQFFFQNLTLSVTRYYNYHHYVRYQKSLIIQSWENLSVGQTHGQTDRRKDESDFIRRCPTNAERPKVYTENRELKHRDIACAQIVFAIR